MLKKLKNTSAAYHPRPLGRGIPGGKDKTIKKIEELKTLLLELSESYNFNDDFLTVLRIDIENIISEILKVNS